MSEDLLSGVMLVSPAALAYSTIDMLEFEE